MRVPARMPFQPWERRMVRREDVLHRVVRWCIHDMCLFIRNILGRNARAARENVQRDALA